MADFITDWDLSFIRDPIPDDSALQIPARYLRGLLARLDAAEKVCQEADSPTIDGGAVGVAIDAWKKTKGIE